MLGITTLELTIDSQRNDNNSVVIITCKQIVSIDIMANDFLIFLGVFKFFLTKDLVSARNVKNWNSFPIVISYLTLTAEYNLKIVKISKQYPRWRGSTACFRRHRFQN